MKYKEIGGINIFAAKSRIDLINYAYSKSKILIAINAEKILHSTSDTRDIINRNLGYPDGIGAVMALKRLGEKDVVKIPGCELWLDIIKEFSQTKKFYLIGGKQEVIENTVKKLKCDFLGIDIVNYRNGYLKREKDKEDLIKDILEKKPDVIFVAMGSPKQELLMEEMHLVHPALYQGLGGSFDVYTGNVKRAPEWWVKNNLEWAYRLLKQPTRIKRQIHLLKFLYLLKNDQL